MTNAGHGLNRGIPFRNAREISYFLSLTSPCWCQLVDLKNAPFSANAFFQYRENRRTAYGVLDSETEVEQTYSNNIFLILIVASGKKLELNCYCVGRVLRLRVDTLLVAEPG